MTEGQTPSGNTGDKITISKDAVYGTAVLVLLVLLALSLYTGGFGLFAKPGTTPPTDNQPPIGNNGTVTPPTGEETLPMVGTIAFGENEVLGQKNAPLTIIQFSDFQCPFCGKFYSGAEAWMKTNLINTGLAKMYYRDYPLGFHDKADDMALASRCAGEQNKFWEMHDIIFGKQSEWSGLPEASVTETTAGYATTIGADKGQFSDCMTKKKYSASIQKDFLDGQSVGVDGTPTTFVMMPKAKTDLNKLKTAANAYPQYIQIAKDSTGNYVVMVTGALPYSVFAGIATAYSG